MKIDNEKELLDITVLLIFFNRPDTFKQVFDSVKKVQPMRLYLACDGPRANHPDDRERIDSCKRIAADIDWECEVHTKYSECNQGCGLGPKNAIDWVFDNEESAVILEDDCVPNITFLRYCEQMIDRYRYDTRIGVISGYNHFKECDCDGYSYCFTKVGATWGWATWKRVWDLYDFGLKSYDASIAKKLGIELLCKRAGKARNRMWKKTKEQLSSGEKISWWDHQFGFLKYSQSLLAIVPHHNLIYNIGLGSDSTHAKHISNSAKWRLGDVWYMPTQAMEFPLKHPKCVICDRKYDQKYFDIIAYPNIWRKVIGRISNLCRRYKNKMQ